MNNNKGQQNTQNNNNQPHPQQYQQHRPMMQQPSIINHQPLPQQNTTGYGPPPQYKNGPHTNGLMQRGPSIQGNGSLIRHPPPQGYIPQQNMRVPPPPMMQGNPSLVQAPSISQYRPVPQSAMTNHNMQQNQQPQQQQQQVSQSRTKIEKKVEEPKHQEPKLQNLVSTANLCTDLQLKDIAYKCKNAEYNPRRFAAVIMRMKEPARTTALIFKTGKMVITGAKSETLSKEAAKAYAKAIQKVGYPNVKMTEFKVQNMVGSCSVDFKIKLESLFHSNHQQFCVFNPDTFPGLIYHMAVPKVCLLIFSSGKIVLTGAKQRQDIDQAFKTIIPLLKQFVKKDLREFDEKKE